MFGKMSLLYSSIKKQRGKGLPDLPTGCWLQLNHLVSSQCAVFAEVEQEKKTENHG